MSEGEETTADLGGYLISVASSDANAILDDSALALDPTLTVESFLSRARPVLPQPQLEEPVRGLLLSDWFQETFDARARPAIAMLVEQELRPNGRDPAWMLQPDKWPATLAQTFPEAEPGALSRAVLRAAALMEAAFLTQVSFMEIASGDAKGSTHWESFEGFVGVWAALIGMQQDPREIPLFSGFFVSTCRTPYEALLAQLEEDGIVAGFRKKKKRGEADRLAGFYLRCGADLGDVIRPPISM